jgi:hypothetical protein
MAWQPGRAPVVELPRSRTTGAMPNYPNPADADAESLQLRLDPILCPHCDQVTMPNLLDDRSAVCSCPAERALPLDLLHGTPWDGLAATAPAPVDVGDNVRPPCLPAELGQFGRDVATEAFAPLASPPGRKG